MIRRAPRPEARYLTVRNDVVRDPRLSYRATGVLLDILSRPDNWTATAKSLSGARPGAEGRDAILKALAELETVGYIRRERVRGDDGRFLWVQSVFDTPQEPAPTGLPGPGNPSLAPPAQTHVSAGHTRTGKPGPGNPASKEELRRSTEPPPQPASGQPDSDPATPAPGEEENHPGTPTDGDDQARSLLRAAPWPPGYQPTARQRTELVTLTRRALGRGHGEATIRDALAPRLDGANNPGAVVAARLQPLADTDPTREQQTAATKATKRAMATTTHDYVEGPSVGYCLVCDLWEGNRVHPATTPTKPATRCQHGRVQVLCDQCGTGPAERTPAPVMATAGQAS